MSEIAFTASIGEDIAYSVEIETEIGVTFEVKAEINSSEMAFYNVLTDDEDIQVSGQALQRVFSALPAGLTLEDMLFFLDDTPLSINTATFPDSNAEVQAYNSSTKTATFKKALPDGVLLRILYPNI